MRLRINRQVNEDQRSMGSIGYIGGNINYMGGGSMNMEYPFENHPGHYNLWKPPSGYFPRGEAPPPYEEAVALAQAESLNAQCTVSVATTTHRTVPVNICSADSTCEIPSNITTNTTNLINININNSGNITSVAAGENHQINKNIYNSNTNHMRRTQALTSNYASLPRTTNHQQQILADPHNNNHSAMIALNNTNSANNKFQQQLAVVPIASIPASTNEQLSQQQRCNSNSNGNGNKLTAQECTYKNCTITQNQSPCCNKKAHKDMQPIATIDLNGMDNQKRDFLSNDERTMSMTPTPMTILPPPLFDENLRNSVSSLDASHSHSEHTKTPSARRHHRTIPRHFTVTDPLVSQTKSMKSSSSNSSDTPKKSSSSSNKKPICQCPIQHVPMTYMGAKHFNSSKSQGDAFLSTLSTTKVSSSSSSSSKQSSLSGKNSSTNSNSKHSSSSSNQYKENILTVNNGGGGESSSQSSTLRRSKGSNKIPTISKQIGANEMNYLQQQQQQQQSIVVVQPPPPLLHQSDQSQQIHSILKNGNNNVQKISKSTQNIIRTNMENSTPFPIQLIESLSKSNAVAENPALPPKMYKTSSNVQQQQQHHHHHHHHHHQQHHQQQQQQQQQQHLSYSPRIHTISTKSHDHYISTAPMTSVSTTRTFSAASILHVQHQQQQQQSNQQQQYRQLPVVATAAVAVASSSITTTTTTQSVNNAMKTLPRYDDTKISAQIYPFVVTTTDKSNSLGKISYKTSFPMLTNHYTLPKPNIVSSAIAGNGSNNKMLLPSNNDRASPAPSSTTIVTSNCVVVAAAAAQTLTQIIASSTTATTATATISATISSSSLNQITTAGAAVIQPIQQILSPPVIPIINQLTTTNNNAIVTKNKLITSNINAKMLTNTTTATTTTDDKPLPVCTTYKNCSNPKEHFLPNDASLDDDYLSECENCKSAHGSRYYLNEPIEEQPQETMTLQRKMDDKQEDDQTSYYRTSSTLPSNTKQKTTTIKSREPWFSTIPASSSSDEELAE